MTLNDLQRRNGPYFSLFHRIRARYVVVKQLLGLHPFQNLLLIVYDHINYDCTIIQRVFGQNNRRQQPRVQCVVAYAHVS